MSRNMKNANIRIFEKICKYAMGSAREIGHAPRCIETSDEDKNWLQHLSIEKKWHILPDTMCVTMIYNKEKYLAIIGWEKLVFDGTLEEILPFENNAGITTALLSELDEVLILSSRYTPLEVLNQFALDSDDQRIVKYNWMDVAEFFPPIQIYKFATPLTNCHRAIGYVLLQNRHLLSLPFSAKTIENFETVFLSNMPLMPYENLVFALVSVHWRFSFLETYRCIENIFALEYIRELHKELKIQINVIELSEKIGDQLSWKPKELSALEKMFNRLSPGAKMILKGMINCPESESRLADRFYKIRNSIVHHRSDTENYVFQNTTEWDLLMQFTLTALIELYSIHDGTETAKAVS